jgi:hypothetical protein
MLLKGTNELRQLFVFNKIHLYFLSYSDQCKEVLHWKEKLRILLSPLNIWTPSIWIKPLIIFRENFKI